MPEPNVWFSMKVTVGFLVSAFATHWRLLPETLRAAVVAAGILMVVDTVLGILRAVCEHKYSSEGVARFFRKFIVYACVVFAAYALDLVLRANAFAETAVVVMIVLTELSSVMDNSEALGFHWPTKVKQRVRQLSATVCGEETCETKPKQKGEKRES